MISCSKLAVLILALGIIPSMSYAQRAYPLPYGAAVQAFGGRSNFYRLNPREDPEPARCTYAADSTCPGRYNTGFNGDPRDDPEPFRCTYAADQDCPNGGKSGIQ